MIGDYDDARKWPGNQKYELSGEKLGAGAYGTVLGAVQRLDDSDEDGGGRRVAVKRIDGAFETRGAVSMVMRELSLNRLVARACPGAVVKALDAFADDACVYLVVERMDRSLSDLLFEARRRGSGGIPASRRLELAARLARYFVSYGGKPPPETKWGPPAAPPAGGTESRGCV